MAYCRSGTFALVMAIFTQQLLRKEFFGTGVTRIEYRVKEQVVRKTLEDVVGASRDDIEDVMWG